MSPSKMSAQQRVQTCAAAAVAAAGAGSGGVEADADADADPDPDPGRCANDGRSPALPAASAAQLPVVNLAEFHGRVLLIGFGAVGRCALPLLLRHLSAPASAYTVMDFALDPNGGTISADLIPRGVKHVPARITPDTMADLLAEHVGPGDLVVDLAWNIGLCDILQWCHDHQVLYINTSTEEWDPYEAADSRPVTERTLYHRHMQLRRAIADWAGDSTTAVLDHGANPGLVSHFTKQGLLDLAGRWLADRAHDAMAGAAVAAPAASPAPLANAGAPTSASTPTENAARSNADGCTPAAEACGRSPLYRRARNGRAEPKRNRADIEAAYRTRDFARLAYLLGVCTIHVSERDTQVTGAPRDVGEFVNTWSIPGFFEEGTAPAEMGWGSHEKTLPPSAHTHKSGPCNQICMDTFGIRVWVRSWVPSGEILGMVIRHGEAFSISERFTLYPDGVPNDAAVPNDVPPVLYRPTVHYAYCPCDEAIASLHELRMRNYQLQPRLRIMSDDIVRGRDELGCLLMGHDYRSWWTGSLLDIDEARRLVPGQNATTVQVAISVVAAVKWMIRNPRRGVRLPDDLPHDEILAECMPYLGQFVSAPVDWSPLDSWESPPFGNVAGVPKPAPTDEWQFSTFLARGMLA